MHAIRQRRCWVAYPAAVLWHRCSQCVFGTPGLGNVHVHTPHTAQMLHAPCHAGKVVIDATNPLSEWPKLEVLWDGSSGGEMLQASPPTAPPPSTCCTAATCDITPQKPSGLRKTSNVLATHERCCASLLHVCAPLSQILNDTVERLHVNLHLLPCRRCCRLPMYSRHSTPSAGSSWASLKAP